MSDRDSLLTGDVASIAEARDVIRRSFPVEEFEPQNTAAWDEGYQRFVKVV